MTISELGPRPWGSQSPTPRQGMWAPLRGHVTGQISEGSRWQEHTRHDFPELLQVNRKCPRMVVVIVETKHVSLIFFNSASVRKCN